ncbi:hypothetical protein ACFQ14_04045 [Pseudahrensia aquimaris]|uniref:Uncharacterized protein n=1 Tax=Pseudahrensia aquimaris TaxID=744461 RepID=A0ABW3FAU1_9HYPH
MKKPVQNPQPPMPRWLTQTLVVASFAVLTGLGAWSLVTWYRSNTVPLPYTTDTALREFSIADESVRVPANIVQLSSANVRQNIGQLDLTLLWPGLVGFSQENRDLFLTEAGARSLIFAAVEKRGNPADMTNRLENVYVPLFDGTPSDGPAGLTFQKLKAGVGYDGEQLAIYAGDDGVWAARCQLESPNGPQVTTCLRDFHVGNNLVVRYRFATELLSQWREIETAMREAALKWVAQP